ncbi:hypothetical protein [Thiolapillus sp.]|uniref:hypothetical protein n=1 Tax=Thiolapillus sp. TaxID=2017437 RepID=UPI003AF56A98
MDEKEATQDPLQSDSVRGVARLKLIVVYLGLFMVSQLSHILASLYLIFCLIIGRNTPRLFRLLITWDYLFNITLNGKLGETYSHRVARDCFEKRQFIGCFVCKFLDLFQKDHCKITYNGHNAEARPFEPKDVDTKL